MTNITFLDHFIQSIEEEVDGIRQECKECGETIRDAYNPCDFHAGTQDVIDRMNVHKGEEEDKQAEALKEFENVYEEGRLANYIHGIGNQLSAIFFTPFANDPRNLEYPRKINGLANELDRIALYLRAYTARRTEGKEES